MSVPTHIGQYRILRTIGAGGMGTVFLGEHQLIGSRAAVKVLHPSLSVHKQIVDRFFTEARAMASIHDPGIAQVFDFGYTVDGTAYIVMEYLEGEPLSARLDRLGVLPVGHALRIARQIAGSLEAAHAIGVVHRDLKPDNVFLIRDPEALGGARTKILDFGICKLGVGGDARVTQTGVMLGTPVYMSPEQCRDSATIDHRSDIYSLGAVLFHMLTGRPPFDHDSVGELIAAHLHEKPNRPGHYADLHETIDALVMACLAKDPSERFQSMADLQAAIDAVLATLPGNTPIDVPVAEAPSVPTPAWFVDSQHPPAYESLEIEPPKPRFRAVHRVVMAIALLAGVGIGMTVTRNLIDDAPSAEAHEAPPPPAAMAVDDPGKSLARETAPAPVAPAVGHAQLEPAPPEETWPEPIEPQADVEKAVDDITQPAPPAKKPPPTVAAKPRPTIRHSPPPKRTAPPTPTHSDTEDLYDSR